MGRSARSDVIGLPAARGPCRAAPPPPSQPGTYALVLRAPRGRTVRVGRLGALALRRGWYVYVGSAFGPGGLAARIRHHLRGGARPRWHIDYLREALGFVEAWCTQDRRPREHLWASVLRGVEGCSIPARRFGASDCRCAAHLFFFESPPPFARFAERLRRAAPRHGALVRAGSPTSARA